MIHVFAFFLTVQYCFTHVFASCANPVNQAEWNKCACDAGHCEEQSTADGDNIECRLFEKAVALPDGTVGWQDYNMPGQGLAWCSANCPAKSKGNSISCAAAPGTVVYQNYYDDSTGKIDPNLRYTAALCDCDNKGLEELADDFITALGAIGDIICTLFVGILTSLVDFAENLVLDTAQGVVGALQAMGPPAQGHTDIINTAKIMKKTSDNIENARSSFGKWLAHKLCGNSLSQAQTDAIFNAIDTAVGVVVSVVTLPVGGEGDIAAGWDLIGQIPKVPGGAESGLGKINKWPNPPEHPDNPIVPKKPPPKHNTEPHTTPHTTPHTEPHTTPHTTPHTEPHTTPHTTPHTEPHTTEPKTSPNHDTTAPHDTHETTPHKTTADPKHTPEACGRHDKRADQGKGGNGKDCKTITHTRILDSVAVPTTHTITCDFNANPQACAHYYSAIKNYGVASTFECTDSYYRNRKVDAPRSATNAWQSQHKDKKWKSYTASTYDYPGDKKPEHQGIPPSCERDEWPPAYLMPKRSEEKLLQEAKYKQIVRWVPALENGGEGSRWRGFCHSNDGGAHNHQRDALDSELRTAGEEKPLNAKLVAFEKEKPEEKLVGVKNGITTSVHIYSKVSFSRAVLSMTFAWGKQGEPSPKNNWFLEDNPCWPKAIVPDDPGYVLLTDDKWYDTQKPALRDSVRGGLYKKAPTPQLVREADKRVQQAKGSQGGKKNPPASGSGHRRRLILDHESDEVLVQEMDFNLTRPLTELERNYIGGLSCHDRDCSWDLEADEDDDGYDDDDDLDEEYFRSDWPSSIPAETDAVPTTMATVTRMQPQHSSGLASTMPINTAIVGTS